MPNRKNVHVVPRKEGWAVKREGAKRASSIHEKQATAWKVAGETAKKESGEAFLHNRKSKIRQRSSFGNDPFPPRDKD